MTPRESHCEKDQEMAMIVQVQINSKKLNNDNIQLNLVPTPSEIWRRQHKFTLINVIKTFAINQLYGFGKN